MQAAAFLRWLCQDLFTKNRAQTVMGVWVIG
jgi:hypothetical protein